MVEEIAARMAAVLRAEPSGLLSDLDGTLAPIVERPDEVALVPGARRALALLGERLVVVGVVTGRAPADARGILGDDGLLVVGNHGTEWLEAGSGVAWHAPGHDGVEEEIAAVVERLSGPLALEPGVRMEPKGLSATIHYRSSPDPAAARRAVLAAVRRTGLPERLEAREGRMSVELRPVGAGKGEVVREAVERHQLRGLVVIGDDRTDLDAFRAAAELRAAGRLAAFVAAVGADPEVPPEVGAAADALIGSPAELVDLLLAVAEELGGR